MRLFGKWFDEKFVDLGVQGVDLPLFGQENLCSKRNNFKTEHIDVDDVRDESELQNVYPFVVSYLENGWWKVGEFGVPREWTYHYLVKKTSAQQTEHIDVDDVRDESK